MTTNFHQLAKDLYQDDAVSQGLDIDLLVTPLTQTIPSSSSDVRLSASNAAPAYGLVSQADGFTSTSANFINFSSSLPSALPANSDHPQKVSHLPACGCFVHRSGDPGTGVADAGLQPQFSGGTGGGSNNAKIDEWIAGLNSGSRWNFTGTGTPTLTYSFYEFERGGGPSYAGEFSQVARNFTRQIFADMASLININFVEVTEAAGSAIGDIRIHTTNESNAYAYAYYPSHGDVYFSTAYDNASDTNGFQSGMGSHGFMTIIHEIGHALGLKHPGNYNGGGTGTGPFLAYGDDNTGNTVMSYNFAGASASSFMLFDILALQNMYGARAWNTGNTTYSFDRVMRFSDGSRSWGSTNNTRLTIWDSNGTDTLNLAGLASSGNGYRFDLNDGGWLGFRNEFNAQTYKARGDSANADYRTTSRGTRLAYGANIENLIGTISSDEILGNSLANSLVGGDGNDTIQGGTGNDTLEGGVGTDTFSEVSDFNMSLTNTSFQRDGVGFGTSTTRSFSSNTPVAIADLATATANLNVSGVAGVIRDVNVRLNITHTYTGDLSVTLISPTGTRIALFASVGGAGANFTNTTLDDEAGTGISGAAAPFTGVFSPIGALSGLDGESANGNWRLEVRDTASGDIGTLTNWSLDFTVAPMLTIVNAETDVLSGFEQANLTGGSGNNQISAAGFAGAVTLTGGGGNDTMTGGNAADTVVYAGNQSEYRFERIDATTWQVTDTVSGANGDEGVDALRQAEALRFNASNTTLQLNQFIGVLSDNNGASNSVAGHAANGTLVGITALATDGDAQAVTYSLLDNASGRFAIDAATGVVRVANGAAINPATAAAYNIVVQASSADGSFTRQTYAINVIGGTNNPNRLPTFTPIGNANITTTNSVFSYVVPPFTDADGHALTYTASLADGSALPTWLTFDAGTRTFSGIMPADFSGSLNLRVTATDSELTSAWDSFTVTVARNNLTGTDGDDNLQGFAFADSIDGGAGSDTLTGGAGDDTLAGGLGTNRLIGGSGNDRYIVTGIDTVSELVGAGNDTVESTVNHTLSSNVENLVLLGTGNINGTGSGDNNSITGNSGNNSLNGGTGNDTLVGGDGADTLIGGTGIDSLVGGTGNDIYNINVVGDVVVEQANEGIDTIQTVFNYTLGANFENLTLMGSAVINGTGNSLSNVILGNAAANSLSGAEGDDSLNGGSGNDLLSGEVGNDSLDGGVGADSLLGGVGNDIYGVDSLIDVITEFANQGSDTVRTTITYTLGTQLENLVLVGTGNISGTGNPDHNSITGNTGANSLFGAEGNDTLSGSSGNDTLIGGNGSDSLLGGLGNDLYSLVSTEDVIIELLNEGTDTVQTELSYTLGDNLENLVLLGLANLSGFGNLLNNVIIGNAGNNLLFGAEGNDTLNGGAGDDTLVGGVGTNSLAGGLGNDLYDAVATGNQITELVDGGIDTVQATLTYTLGNNLENLTLLGTTNLNGTGNLLNNLITGNSGANSLSGADGNDTLQGGAGNDTLLGGTGLDSLMGGQGDDLYSTVTAEDVIVEAAGAGVDTVQTSVSLTLSNHVENLFLLGTAAINGVGSADDNSLLGNTANNSLSGAGGNDTLNGGLGNDTLAGDAGSDQLIGGAGVDILTGGTGVDQFVFGGTGLSLSSMGIDTLSDFASEDRIQLNRATFTALTAAVGNTLASNLFATVTSLATAQTSGALIVYNSADGSLYYNQNGTNTGFGTGAQFASLAGLPSLSASSFVLS